MRNATIDVSRGLAAAGVLLATPARALAAADQADVLRRLIAAEDAAAFAYEQAKELRLSRQEAAHAAALRPQLEALAQPVPPPLRDLDPLRAPGRRLAAARTPHARAVAAVAVERELLDAYTAALGALQDPATIRTAATIMASHGQHLVLAYGAAGWDFLPAAR
jgi:hypothetical protein